MQELYYTPTPEDFRRGFEFEVLYLYPSERWIPEVFDATDKADTYSSVPMLQVALNGRKWEDHVRVPHLTADQIEAEGWENTEPNTFERPYREAFRHVLIYLPNTHSICIRRDVLDMMPVLYNGSCRCINDFRLICKLINIKS